VPARQVIDTATPERLEAAQTEEDLMQRIAAGGRGGSSGGGGGHWVQLLDSWHGHACGATGGAGARPRAAAFLAMAPLHQTAAFVLAYQGGRGRRGLPPRAVRGLARQALVALDELHT
jgi:hypothetical protein